MKWLQDNFVGMALLAGITMLLLVSLTLAVIWAWPVSGEVSEQADIDTEAAATAIAANTIGPFEDYQVINERPIFSVTRQPVALDDEEDGAVLVEETIAVKDAPDVKLTGIFISPGLRIASLMPVQGEQISVTAKEGESLIGDYVGWQISQVRPRHVVLESKDGRTLKLELKVHDSVIEEPPKMGPSAADVALTNAGEDAVPVGEDGQPLSRAEQIRARIAERREELRRQQQGAESDDPAQAGEEQKAAPPPDYQSAIRALMNNSNKDNKSNDKDDS